MKGASGLSSPTTLVPVMFVCYRRVSEISHIGLQRFMG